MSSQVGVRRTLRFTVARVRVDPKLYLSNDGSQGNKQSCTCRVSQLTADLPIHTRAKSQRMSRQREESWPKTATTVLSVKIHWIEKHYQTYSKQKRFGTRNELTNIFKDKNKKIENFETCRPKTAVTLAIPCCSSKTSWLGRMSTKKGGPPTKCQARKTWKWVTTSE